MTAAVVLGVAIVARFAWVMSYNRVLRAGDRAAGGTSGGRWRGPRRAALVISWAGMRGIVTLAAAFAIPETCRRQPFPYRDLILLCAFAVVLGTLVLQGLTLKPLILALH